MSKKQKKDKAARSTRQLMGIEEIKDYCIATRMGNLVFFIIKPTNISVLPDSSISARIYALLNVVKGQAEIEMLALNSKESFERNKDFYRERLSQEELPAVRRRSFRCRVFRGKRCAFLKMCQQSLPDAVHKSSRFFHSGFLLSAEELPWRCFSCLYAFRKNRAEREAAPPAPAYAFTARMPFSVPHRRRPRFPRGRAEKYPDRWW